MRLAHIVPVSLLGTLPKNQRTHLVLSELVLSDERYYRFYVNCRERGDFLILDNPVHEDRPVTIDRWLEAIRQLLPDVAVIPDVIDSDEETVKNAVEAIARLREDGFSGIKLMAVPHGVTQADWLTCARVLEGLGPAISWFGLSLERRLSDDMHALNRRRERVQLLKDEPRFDRIKLHLLGTSECGYEFSDDKIWRRASSADSSKFAVWCMYDNPVLPPVPLTEPYPGRKPFGGSYDYFFAPVPEWLSPRKMSANLRRWCSYAERELD